MGGAFDDINGHIYPRIHEWHFYFMLFYFILLKHLFNDLLFRIVHKFIFGRNHIIWSPKIP